jgi:diaminopimelate decarboxylase
MLKCFYALPKFYLNKLHSSKTLRFIDFGSGFKVPYKPDDYYTDVNELGQKLSERFIEFCKSYGRDLDLWFEPGKFLVSESGTFLAKVNVLKQTTATVFVGLDSGLNHLIRPMLYNSYHHITNVSNPTVECIGSTQLWATFAKQILLLGTEK